MAIVDMMQNMTLTFYSADIVSVFKSVDIGIIKKISKELSELTLRLPIYYKPEEYKKREFIKAIENIKSVYLSADPDNHIKISINEKVIKNKVTPLYLMALFTYCVDRLSGGQIEDKSEYLRMGKMLVK